MFLTVPAALRVGAVDVEAEEAAVLVTVVEAPPTDLREAVARGRVEEVAGADTVRFPRFAFCCCFSDTKKYKGKCKPKVTQDGCSCGKYFERKKI